MAVAKFVSNADDCSGFGAVIVPPWIAGTCVLLENLYLRPKRLPEGTAIA